LFSPQPINSFLFKVLLRGNILLSMSYASLSDHQYMMFDNEIEYLMRYLPNMVKQRMVGLDGVVINPVRAANLLGLQVTAASKFASILDALSEIERIGRSRCFLFAAYPVGDCYEWVFLNSAGYIEYDPLCDENSRKGRATSVLLLF